MKATEKQSGNELAVNLTVSHVWGEREREYKTSLRELRLKSQMSAQAM